MATLASFAFKTEIDFYVREPKETRERTSVLCVADRVGIS